MSSEIDLDLVSAVAIAGPAADRWVLDRLRENGFDGLRPAHGYLIQRLLAEPQPVGELAVALGVSQQAVSKGAAELVAAGYVERTADGPDRRRRPLALTRRGRDMVAESRRVRAVLIGRVGDAVAPGEYDAARRVLQALVGELGLTGAVARRAVPPPD